VADRTELRSYVSDQNLDELYRRASCSRSFSDYEVIRLTPLEGARRGRYPPIVVADTAVAREVYGDAAVYVSAGGRYAARPSRCARC